MWLFLIHTLPGHSHLARCRKLRSREPGGRMRRPWLLLLHHQLTVVCYAKRRRIGQLLSPLTNENKPIFSLDQSQCVKGKYYHWLTSQIIDQSRASLKSDSRIHHFLKMRKRKNRVIILIGISMYVHDVIVYLPCLACAFLWWHWLYHWSYRILCNAVL